MKKDVLSRSLSIALFLLSMGLFLSFIQFSIAQDYPSRPISIIAPFPPGGVTDLQARTFASIAEKELGQPVVIVNKPGGRALIGGNAVATAKPDGYTLGYLLLSATIPETYEYFQKPPYTSKDLKPIAQLCIISGAVVVRKDAPWKSFGEMIEYARKNPVFKFGGYGEGTLAHLAMVSVSKKERIPITHVPFDGDTQVLTALLGGQIPMGAINIPALKSQLTAGNVRLLAIYGGFERVDVVPDVPTLPELGYSIPFTGFNGFFAPKGTPDPIIARLNTTIEKVTKDPSFLEKMRNVGTQVHYLGPEKFRENLAKYKVNVETLFKELGYSK